MGPMAIRQPRLPPSAQQGQLRSLKSAMGLGIRNVRFPAPEANMRDVAIVVGGSLQVFEEYEQAKTLVESAGKTFEVFCVNDMIAAFPHHIDHAVTLHPEKFGLWCSERLRAGLPGLTRVWGHRPFEGYTDCTTEWG